MNPKLNIEKVREEFNSRGFTLVTKKYKNSRQSFEYICPNGHKGKMRIDHVRRGIGCPICSGTKKLTIEKVEKSFKEEGYILLTKEYKNSKQKMDYICPKGHKNSMSWANWRTGHRCSGCFGTHKPKFKNVKASFEEAGYTLLSKEYVNKNTKLISICPNGHTYKVSWEGWIRANSRCQICYMERIMPTFEEVKSSFEAEGYTLLSTKYVNANTKLKCVCNIGHQCNITWSDWREGHRCRKCYNISISGPLNYNWKGGTSFEPYCEIWKDKEYKGDIRNRDGNKCLNPYCDSPDNTDLTIHHIDYDKKNCKPSNLITVCRSCNAKANKDRDWHKNWYQAIMNKRYNYENKKNNFQK